MIFHKYIFEYYTKFNFKFLDVRGYIGLFFHCIETDRDRGLRYREGQRERERCQLVARDDRQMHWRALLQASSPPPSPPARH